MASNTIGQYLRNLRETKGDAKGFWSLRSVSDRANISDSYLSQLETGQADNPSPEVLRQLADALRHPYIDLMKEAGYLPDDESDEIRVLKTLSKDVIEALADPLARKALLVTHYAKKKSEPLVSEVLEIISQMDTEKLQALIKLCDP